jgi:hypothetical protein
MPGAAASSSIPKRSDTDYGTITKKRATGIARTKGNIISGTRSIAASPKTYDTVTQRRNFRDTFAFRTPTPPTVRAAITNSKNIIPDTQATKKYRGGCLRSSARENGNGHVVHTRSRISRVVNHFQRPRIEPACHPDRSTAGNAMASCD